MKARLQWTVFALLVIGGLALADGRPTLGPPVEAPPDVEPSNKTLIKRASGVTPKAVLLPPVSLAEFQTPVARPPATPLLADRPCSPDRLWIEGDALLWWMRKANLPPLITASPVGTPLGNVGVLGVPGTSVLFGGPVNGDLVAGGRIAAGYWLNDDQTCAVEGYFFQLGAITAHGSAGSPGTVGRPFYNVATGLPDAQLVSFPGLIDGAVHADASTGSLLGAGVLARANLFRDCTRCVDALVGYRYLSLSDNVPIAENLTATDPTGAIAPLGTNLLLADNFHTANQFHGADFGLTGTATWNSWKLLATARVALGTTYEHVDINGATSITVPGFPTVTSPGGLLALSSNSGAFSRNVFAVVPEARIRLLYDLNARTSIHFGYSFLYWSRVVRAGDQIDLAVNPGLLPPPLPGTSPLRPAFNFNGTSFWAQGIDLGVDFRF